MKYHKKLNLNRRRLLIIVVAIIGSLLMLSTVLAASSMQDNFDPGINGSQWSNISNGAAGTTCGSISGNALTFEGGGERSATTRSLDVSSGGDIFYSLYIGNRTSDAGGCDTADAGEGVVLEYSTNGGSSWTIIASYAHNYFFGSLTWGNFSHPIPPAAQTSSTLFRWRQLSHSPGAVDHWALDNVFVGVGGSAAGFTLPPCSSIRDGRINYREDRDCAAPVAIYVNDDFIDFYGIDKETGKGGLALRVTFAEIEALGTPDVNTLLAEGTILKTGQPLALYLLATGELQLNTRYWDGKPFIIVWTGKGENPYHLAW